MGTHREVQLEGGRAIDSDQARQRAVDEGVRLLNRTLNVVVTDFDQFPAGASLRVDPSTGTVVS